MTIFLLLHAPFDPKNNAARSFTHGTNRGCHISKLPHTQTYPHFSSFPSSTYQHSRHHYTSHLHVAPFRHKEPNLSEKPTTAALPMCNLYPPPTIKTRVSPTRCAVQSKGTERATKTTLKHKPLGLALHLYQLTATPLVLRAALNRQTTPFLPSLLSLSLGNRLPLTTQQFSTSAFSHPHATLTPLHNSPIFNNSRQPSFFYMHHSTRKKKKRAVPSLVAPTVCFTSTVHQSSTYDVDFLHTPFNPVCSSNLGTSNLFSLDHPTLCPHLTLHL